MRNLLSYIFPRKPVPQPSVNEILGSLSTSISALAAAEYRNYEESLRDRDEAEVLSIRAANKVAEAERAARVRARLEELTA